MIGKKRQNSVLVSVMVSVAFGSSLDARPWPPDHHISCAQEFLCSGNVRRIENEEAIPFYRNRLFILQSPHISCGREFLEM